MVAVLWIIAVLSNVTAVQRIVYTYVELKRGWSTIFTSPDDKREEGEGGGPSGGSAVSAVAFAVAGGQSRRMGRDKALLPGQDRPPRPRARAPAGGGEGRPHPLRRRNAVLERECRSRRTRFAMSARSPVCSPA